MNEFSFFEGLLLLLLVLNFEDNLKLSLDFDLTLVEIKLDSVNIWLPFEFLMSDDVVVGFVV